MLDHEFRENVIASLARLEENSKTQLAAIKFARDEHVELDKRVDSLKTRMDWFTGVGSTLFFMVTAFMTWMGILHRAK